MDAPAPFVVLDGVSYEDEVSSSLLLKSVTLEIPQGVVLCVASANQQEATLFLRILAQNVLPTHGVLTYSNAQRSEQAASFVSAVWADKGFFPELSLFNNLFLGVPLKWGTGIWTQGPLRAQVEQLYQELGFRLTWHSHCYHLSRKERVAALIVRGLLRQKSLYIFDRIFDELEDDEFSHVQRKLQDLVKGGATVIFSTGSLPDRVPICTSLALFSCGQLSFFGAPSELSSLEIQCYLVNDSHSARLLIGKELKRLHYEAREPLVFIERTMGLLSILLRDTTLFCMYRDLSQEVHFFSRSRLETKTKQYLEEIIRKQLTTPSTILTQVVCEDMEFTLFPLTADPSIVNQSVVSQRIGILGYVPRSLAIEFPIQTFVREFNEILCTLMLEGDFENRVKHRQRLDSLGLLAGGVAHDLNNSLMALSGATEMMQCENTNQTLTKYLDMIMMAVNDAQSLTSKLLSFSQKGGQAFQVVDLHEIIRDAVSLLQRGMQQKVELVLMLHAHDVTLKGDAVELKNMIMNIGLNAVQAVDPHKGRVLFATRNVYKNLELEQNGHMSAPVYAFELAIMDNGPGLCSDVLDRIFEPFFSTKHEMGGSGLGLSVVYGTVKEHKGSITASNNIDTGAKFSLHFPILATEVPALSPVSPPDLSKGTASVLVCDDDDRVRFVLVAMLELLGYSVLEASSGPECIAVYQANHQEIDVVLIDDLMPVMAGKECFYQLKAQYPDVKALIISGFRQSDSASEMEEDGLCGFLQKPVSFDVLSTTLKQILVKA